MRALLLLPLLCAPAPETPALETAAREAPAREMRPAAAQGAAEAEALRGWLAELDRGRAALGPAELQAGSALVARADRVWSRGGDPDQDLATALLDLLGRLLERERSGAADGPAAPAEERLRRQTLAALVARADALERWLAFDVAPLARRHPAGRRAAACRVLGGAGGAAAQLSLFACTRAPEREVRDAAVAALVGRDDPAVHELMLDLLEAAEEGRVEVSKGPLERHLAALSLERGTPLHSRVAVYVRRSLTAASWRRASRAVAVSRALDERSAAPMLIETLSIWITRAAAGVPSRRLQGELARELERRSGRRLGPRPERWRAWWKAVQEGRIGFEGHVEGQPESFSRADFFGLRPMTDRLVFVLDRSGSMETPFGQGRFSETPGNPRTRLREAVSQMSAFLQQLGPTTRFDLVLFSDAAQVWSGILRPATAENVQAAARWALELGASGGTHLKPGVLAAMGVDAQGRIDLDRLEADTVVVLCDGETAEGAAWVRPLLRRVNDEARLVFHAVRIGGRDDGALRALVEESGGELALVDG